MGRLLSLRWGMAAVELSAPEARSKFHRFVFMSYWIPVFSRRPLGSVYTLTGGPCPELERPIHRTIQPPMFGKCATVMRVPSVLRASDVRDHGETQTERRLTIKRILASRLCRLWTFVCCTALVESVCEVPRSPREAKYELPRPRAGLRAKWEMGRRTLYFMY